MPAGKWVSTEAKPIVSATRLACDPDAAWTAPRTRIGHRHRGPARPDDDPKVIEGAFSGSWNGDDTLASIAQDGSLRLYSPATGICRWSARSGSRRQRRDPEERWLRSDLDDACEQPVRGPARYATRPRSSNPRVGRHQRRWLFQRNDGPPAGLSADRARATRRRQATTSSRSCPGGGDHDRSRLHDGRDGSDRADRSRPASTPRTTRIWRTSSGQTTGATRGCSSGRRRTGVAAPGDGVASLSLSNRMAAGRNTPGSNSAAGTSRSSASVSRRMVSRSWPSVRGTAGSAAFVAARRRSAQRRFPWLRHRRG